MLLGASLGRCVCCAAVGGASPWSNSALSLKGFSFLHLLADPIRAYVAGYVVLLPCSAVDGDGLVDIVTVHPTVSYIQWHKSGGGPSPTWTTSVISQDSDYPLALLTTDVDGDGWVDALSAAFFGGTVDWVRNEGGSPPVWTHTVVANFTQAQVVGAVDVDGDGRVDVLAASANGNKAAWYHRDDQ